MAEHPDTYYTRTLRGAVSYPALSGQTHTDVCVIGGGLAGLNTALGLAERGRSVLVLESGRIGSGASGRNGGFVAKGYSAGEGVLADTLGAGHARALIQLSRAGRALIRQRIQDYAIDCGPIIDGVLTVSWRDRPQMLRAKAEKLNGQFGLDLEFWPRERVRQHCLTEKYYDGLFSPGDFQFHPLNYVHGIARAITAKGGHVYENSRTQRIEKDGNDYIVHTDGGQVRARHVVLCCSIDVGGLDKRLARSSFPVLTFIMVTDPVDPALLNQSINTQHAIYDMRFSSDYYRVLPDNRILWGGRVALRDNPGAIGRLLMGDLLKVYPQLEGHVKAEMAWSGRLCYAPHKMPQIGRMDEGYWYCTCFGGHGLVPTTVGGETVAAAIADGSRQIDLFAPFGLDYAGGRLGPVAAQSVYYWWRLRDKLGL